MEKTHNSFNKNGHIPTTPRNDASNDHHNHLQHCVTDEEAHQIAEKVDRFITDITAIDDKASPIPEVPDFIKTFSQIIESRITRHNSRSSKNFAAGDDDDDAFFIDSVRRISRLTNALSEFSSDANVNSPLNQTSVALQRAMVFLEEEFRSLLEDSTSDWDPQNEQNFQKFSSFNSKSQQEYSDRCAVQREMDSAHSAVDYPAYSPDDVAKMHEIATTMISAGYETECCQVYYISRRSAIRNHMVKLDLEVLLNMDDVVKMPSETLEAEMKRWLSVVKTCSDIIFPGEKKLGESVFSDYPPIRRSLTSNILRAVVIQLLDFAEAMSMAKRSMEKMFNYLDMYQALQSLITAIGGESYSDELTAEVNAAVDRLSETVVCTFCDLENSIKSDGANAKTAVAGGAVHPLTRYVMNYLGYMCQYTNALEEIFAKHAEPDKKYIPNNLTSHDLERESESPHNFETVASTTPFSIQVVTVMDLLDANLEQKSRLYKDASLRCVFLMNNGRYILQKVKGEPAIRQVMGDIWCRRRSTVVRQYHKNYQRETWNRVLQCLSHDGLLVNGKANKTLLKERFKIFTTIFDEIHRTQSTWIVSDEQLQSELRISVSAVVIPAYRAFVGRFRQYLDSGKQADKYIKYQPEDIEALIEDLFEGNTSSMARRKT